MDTIGFEARLEREGYPEIRTNALQPNCYNAEHSRPQGVKYLVGRRRV